MKTGVRILLVLVTCSICTQAAFYQPVDVGFQFATPYNLANTLTSSVGGPIALALASVFGTLLLVGLVILPLSKLLGFHLGQVAKIRKRRELPENFSWINILSHLEFEDAFTFLDEDNVECKRKLVCHVHSALVRAPLAIQTTYRFISRHLRGVAAYKDDILRGFRGDDCTAHYKCEKTLGQQLADVTFLKRAMSQAAMRPGFSENRSEL